MRKIGQEIDDLLLQYLEGNLDEKKLSMINKSLESSESLRDRLEALKMISYSLQQSHLLHPSDNFTKRVMNNLHRIAPVSVITPKNGVLLLCGILVAMGIGVVMVDTGFYNSLNGILSLDQIKVPSGLAMPSLPAIPLSGKLIINSIIALNLGLAFLLLDRTILKPFFNRRSRMQF